MFCGVGAGECEVDCELNKRKKAKTERVLTS